MLDIFTSYLLAIHPALICPLPSHILSISSEPISQACTECTECTVCSNKFSNSVIFTLCPSLVGKMTVSQNRVGFCRIFGLFWQIFQKNSKNNFQCFALAWCNFTWREQALAKNEKNLHTAFVNLHNRSLLRHFITISSVKVIYFMKVFIGINRRSIIVDGSRTISLDRKVASSHRG